jgi:hypothetical protein
LWLDAKFCEEAVMKFLSGLLLVASAIFVGGCTMDTPAYSAKERFAQIHRNDVYQLEAANDDVDWFLLSRPSNQETIWNVYHR